MATQLSNEPPNLLPETPAEPAPDQPSASPQETAAPSQWNRLKHMVHQAVSKASPAPGPRWAAFPPQTPRRKAKWAVWLLVLVLPTLEMIRELTSADLWPALGGTGAALGFVAAPLAFAFSLTRLAKGPLATWRWQTIALAVIVFGSESWAVPTTALIIYCGVLALVGHYQEPAVLAGVGLIAGGLMFVAARLLPFAVAATIAAAVLVPLMIGQQIGSRARSRGELSATKVALTAQSEHAAVLEERARIARDLHDVVAHRMSLIAIQAEAAQIKQPDLPQATQQSLSLIRQAAGDALAETRSLVGMLRSDSDEPSQRAPAPTFDGIAELVANAQSGGLEVQLMVTGQPRPAPAATALAAYRIVQESLANAARHAPSQPVQVQINWLESDVEVMVQNQGNQESSDLT
ncbi:MAG: histidine kinase [Micrococcales bacterium]|nr:histidine kinase [Micrococcales bacterium]